MASEREERRLQRQRGAQRHQVEDVDFGTPFPVATAPTQRTTRSGGTPQPQAKSPKKPTTPTPTSIANDANTSAKRKRLEVQQDVTRSSPARSTRSRTTPRRDIFELEEDGPAAEAVEKRTPGQAHPEINLQGGAGKPKILQTPRLNQVVDSNEISESPKDAVGSGPSPQIRDVEIQALEREERRLQRQRGAQKHQVQGVDFGKPFPAATIRQATPPPPPSAQVLTPSGPSSSRREGAVRTTVSPGLPILRSPRVSQANTTLEEIDELSPDRPERPSQIQQRDLVDDQEEGEDEDEAEAIDDVEAARYLQRPSKRKSSQAEINWEPQRNEGREPDEEIEPEAELYNIPVDRSQKTAKPASKRRKTKAKASPAAQQQPKKSKSTSNARKSSGTIPVVVHRLTKPVTYGENDSDADILIEDVPFTKRSGVNAVDVLSQFCEEVVESGLSTLEEGGSNAEDAAIRREYTTKLRAVEAFQEELRTRLLELTVALDADYLLDKRVRAAQKEKVQLREELLRLRAEREQIALRMDDVRIKHEESSKGAQEQATLNTSLHDIELAVSTALDKAPSGVSNDPSPPDLATLLKMIAGDVSSKSPPGGRLKQVKEFNAFLERAALALEGRSRK